MSQATSTDVLVDQLAELVSCESPSADVTATGRCASLVDKLGRDALGEPAERIVVDQDRVHLRWSFGAPRVLLLGHFDTVWPVGTLARWPFVVDGERATGPGAFDMKTGIVQTFSALRGLDRLDGVTVLLTSDEEIGSVSSTPLITSTAQGLDACLVLEPSANGALKLARKGVGMFRIGVTGRSAHAGLEPHLGVNASVEAAHQVLAVTELARDDSGTTVTPTVLRSGTTVNTVPAAAEIAVDVRAETSAEMERVTAGMSALRPVLPEAKVDIEALSVRPPLERTASAGLFARARAISDRLDLGELTGVAVGGGSDGNLTAAAGVATLDGLGAVGGNAHAEGEWVSLSQSWGRIDLVTALIAELLEDR